MFPISGADRIASGVGHEEDNAGQRLRGPLDIFLDHNGLQADVFKHDCLGIARVDLHAPLFAAKHIAFGSPGFPDNIGIGIKVGQADLAVAVSVVNTLRRGLAFVVVDITAVDAGDQKLRAGQRFAGDTVHFPDNQAALRGIVEGHCLGFARTDLDALGSAVEDIAGGRLQFFGGHGHAGSEPGDDDAAGAVGRKGSIIGAKNHAAAVSDEENDALDGICRALFVFLESKDLFRRVPERKLLGLPADDADVLGSAVEDVAVHCLDLTDLDRDVRLQIVEDNLTGGIGVIHTGIRTQIGAVAGGDPEGNALQRLIVGPFNEFADDQGAELAVLKGHAVQRSTPQVCGLEIGAVPVTLGRLVFGHDYGRVGREPGQGHGPVVAGDILLLIANQVPRRVLDCERSASEQFAGVDVPLDNRQGGQSFVVEPDCLRIRSMDHDCLRHGVEHVTLRSLGFRHDIRGGTELGEHDLTVFVGGVDSVRAGEAFIVRSEFSTGGDDLELSAFQRLASGLVELFDDQSTFRRIIEGQELGVVGIDHDGLRPGFRIDHIARNWLLFSHDEGPSDVADHDLAVPIRGIEAVGRELAIIHHSAIGIGDFEHAALQGLTRQGVQLVDHQRTLGRIAKHQGLGVAGVDQNRLRLRNTHVSIRSFDLGHNVRSGVEFLQHDLAVGVHTVKAIGTRQAFVVRGQFTIRSSDLELSTNQRLAGRRIDLLDDQGALGLITELQNHGLIGSNLDGLRSVVQHIAGDGPGLFCDDGFAGLQVWDEDTSRIIRGVIAVGIADHSTVGIRDEELHVGKRLASQGIFLDDEQAAHLLIAVNKRNEILRLTRQIHRPGARFAHHITGGGGDLLHDIRAFVEIGDLDLAIFVGDVLAQGAAVHGGHLIEILQSEPSAGKRLASLSVHFLNEDSAQRHVLNGDHFVRAGCEVAFIDAAVLNPISVRSLRFGDLIPSVPELVQMDNALRIGDIVAQIVDFAGECVVGSVDDMELCSFHRPAGGCINFLHGQRGFLEVLELDDAKFVRNQGDFLRDRIQQILIGHALLGDLIDAGLHFLKINLTVRVCSLSGQSSTVHFLDSECGTGDRYAGHSVLLNDFQVGLLFIAYDKLGILPREQFHVEFGFVEDIPGRGVHLHDAVHAGLQVVDRERTIHVRNAVQVVRSILNFGNPESRAGDPLVQVGVILDDSQAGFSAVREDEPGAFASIDPDCALCVIGEIVLRRSDLFANIASRLKVRQIDLAGGVSRELFAVGAAHQADPEPSIGQRFLGLGVNFEQMNPGFDEIQKHQSIAFVAGLDLDLLGCGINHIARLDRDLLDQIGAGLKVVQKDLTVGISGVSADQFSVPVDFKGGIRKEAHGLLIVLHNLQTGFPGVRKHQGVGLFAGLDLDLLRSIVQDITILDGGFLHDVSAGREIGEHDFTVIIRSVGTDQGRITVDLKRSIAQRFLRFSIQFADLQMRLAAVGDRDLRIRRGAGIVGIHIDAVLRGIQDVTGGGDGLNGRVVSLGHIGDCGHAIIIGGNGGHQLAVAENFKSRTRQAAEVAFIALIDNQFGFPHIPERDGNVVFAVPVHGLLFGIQLITLRRGDLVNLVRAQRQLIRVELDDASVVGDSRSVITAVDLLERDGRTLEGIAVLGVDLTDCQRLLRRILDGHIIRPRRLDRHIHRVGDGVTSRGLGLGQGILNIRLQIGPQDVAARVGRAGNGTAVGTAERKLGTFQRLTAAADFRNLEIAGFSLLAAPCDNCVGSESALGGVSDDIALLSCNGVVRQVDLILHDVGSAVDCDLSGIRHGIHRNTELGPAPVFEAVVVDVRGVDDGGDPPGRNVPEAAVSEFLIVFINEHIPGRRAVGPDLNIIIVVVGRSGGREDVLAGIVGTPANDLALDPKPLVVCGIFESHVARNRDVPAQFVFFEPDVHTRVVNAVPLLSRVQDQLYGPEDTHLLRISGRLCHIFAACGKRTALDAQLAKGRPHSDLGRVHIFLFRQAVQHGFTGETVEERLNGMLRITVSKRAGCRGAGVVLAPDLQRVLGHIEHVIDTVRGAAETVVGRIAVRKSAEPFTRSGGQQELALIDGNHLAGGTPVADGRSAGTHDRHDAENREHSEDESKGPHPILFGMGHVFLLHDMEKAPPKRAMLLRICFVYLLVELGTMSSFAISVSQGWD